MSKDVSDHSPDHHQRRCAVYLRVSTERQYVGEASIPSQREYARAHCDRSGIIILDHFIEAATATDDKRPELQKMISRACSPEKPYDVIVFYAFNRFFRNVVEMELTIRKLRRHGVEVESITQPRGDDASHILLRQIIGAFDEHTSREISKNTSRAMRECAKQGFWNGSPSPLGYKIVASEIRGPKVKKKLAVDIDEAKLVSLIFKLYLSGEKGCTPLGVKDIAYWLNRRNYRTRRGRQFGPSNIHSILTRSYYSTGMWPYRKRKSVDGNENDSSVIHIPIPPLIDQSTFDEAQTKLKLHRPRTMPPRHISSPALLSGMASCALCGSGMGRTATTRRGQRYSYYSCSNFTRRGRTACENLHIPADTLDEIVTKYLQERLLTQPCAADILTRLLARLAQRKLAENEFREFKMRFDELTLRLCRIYAAIEDGTIEMDDLLGRRVSELKDQRQSARYHLDSSLGMFSATLATKADNVAALIDILRTKLRSGDVNARREVARAVIARIEVDRFTVRFVDWSSHTDSISRVIRYRAHE